MTKQVIAAKLISGSIPGKSISMNYFVGTPASMVHYFAQMDNLQYSSAAIPDAPNQIEITMYISDDDDCNNDFYGTMIIEILEEKTVKVSFDDWAKDLQYPQKWNQEY
jgi:hypothetical protein